MNARPWGDINPGFQSRFEIILPHHDDAPQSFTQTWCGLHHFRLRLRTQQSIKQHETYNQRHHQPSRTTRFRKPAFLYYSLGHSLLPNFKLIHTKTNNVRTIFYNFPSFFTNTSTKSVPLARQMTTNLRSNGFVYLPTHVNQS